MGDHLFLSYSRRDGVEFALRLADELGAGPPPVPVWVDQRRLRPGEDWGEQIVEAIRASRALLFVVSRDSVQTLSECKNEWGRALKYKKPVIPLIAHGDAEVPFRLDSLQYIDFTGSRETALAALRNHLAWMTSPEGQLHYLEYRLADARRELPRAGPGQQARVRDDIAELERQIARQKAIIENPGAAEQRVQESIQEGIARVHEPVPAGGAARPARYVNQPPAVAPTWFQDRHVESGLIGDFLKDAGLRLMTVVGRGGIGKSAMVCRLLKSIEGGQLPDDRGSFSVDGIVYLSNSRSFHRVTVPELFAGLTRLLPEEAAARANRVYRDPQAGTRETIQALVAEFSAGTTVVLLDNFEDAVDAESGRIREGELDEALRELLESQPHGIKVIITTRVAPSGLSEVEPGRQRRLDLDKGLEHPFAEKVLRAMDSDGRLGLRDGPEALLAEARERTRGNPRALEHLYGILSADRDTTLKEILEDTRRLLPERVVEVLVGEAFNRLDATAERVMIALAAYRYPVPAAATDYLLQPYVPGVDSGPVLKRLVNMQFVRRESGRYYLHQVDRDYALSRIPQGAAGDWAQNPPPLTRLALTHRAAEWFRQIRKPDGSWRNLEDLTPQLSEYELRIAAGEHDEAARILLSIDFNYLMLWGHFRLVTELHERLQNRLSDPALVRNSLGNLGTAHYRIGNYQQAISCYELARSLSVEHHDDWGAAVWLGNLGVVYADLGQTARAVECYEQALAKRRVVRDRGGEAHDLVNLAIEYRACGRTDKAIEYYLDALAINREQDSPREVALTLNNLGEAYCDLGDNARARECLNDALAMARQTGYRLIEMAALTSLGLLCLDGGEFAEGAENLRLAVELADGSGNNQMQSEARVGLTLALLYGNELAAARETAEQARRIDFPLGNHRAWLVLGVTALRLGDLRAAWEALSSAVAQADTMLARNAESFEALDVKGLALCGLALCENVRHLAAAKAAFAAARRVHSAPGIVSRLLRLFDALARADSTGVLAEARPAAQGAGG